MTITTTGKPTVVDLFAGCGGLSLGLSQAGFKSLALVEHDKWACLSLRLNAEKLGLDWSVYEQDVSAFRYLDLSERVDVLAAGAPCQPFSLAGRHRADLDERNMFPTVFHAIRQLNPKVVLLENVRGLLRPAFRPYFEYLVSQLRHPGVAPLENEDWRDHHRRIIGAFEYGKSNAQYSVEVPSRAIHAADYGVPQSRYRLFMVAVRSDLGRRWVNPDPTRCRDRLLWDQHISGDYWRDHDMPRRPVPAAFRSRVARLERNNIQPELERWRTVRDELIDLPAPIVGTASATHSFHVGIPDARLYKGHTGNDLDLPSKTIKAGMHGNPGGEHILIEDNSSPRYFSVRECARMQSFPDCYVFAGSRSQAIKQIGNAVPPSLARMFGDHIRDHILGPT